MVSTIGSFNTSLISESFSDISELEQTIEQNLLRDDDGMFRCAMCSKITKNRGHLKEHIETHIEGLSFPCQYCLKPCRTRASLRVHQYSAHRSSNQK